MADHPNSRETGAAQENQGRQPRRGNRRGRQATNLRSDRRSRQTERQAEARLPSGNVAASDDQIPIDLSCLSALTRLELHENPTNPPASGSALTTRRAATASTAHSGGPRRPPAPGSSASAAPGSSSARTHSTRHVPWIFRHPDAYTNPGVVVEEDPGMTPEMEDEVIELVAMGRHSPESLQKRLGQRYAVNSAFRQKVISQDALYRSRHTQFDYHHAASLRGCLNKYCGRPELLDPLPFDEGLETFVATNNVMASPNPDHRDSTAWVHAMENQFARLTPHHFTGQDGQPTNDARKLELTSTPGGRLLAQVQQNERSSQTPEDAARSQAEKLARAIAALTVSSRAPPGRSPPATSRSAAAGQSASASRPSSADNRQPPTARAASASSAASSNPPRSASSSSQGSGSGSGSRGGSTRGGADNLWRGMFAPKR